MDVPVEQPASAIGGSAVDEAIPVMAVAAVGEVAGERLAPIDVDHDDITGDWPTRAGASQAIASAPRHRAQAWARAIYDAYPTVEGVWYPSSVHGGHPAVALFKRAADALPDAPELDIPLTHPGLLADLTRAANALGYLIR